MKSVGSTSNSGDVVTKAQLDTKAASGVNSDITSITGITGVIELNGQWRFAANTTTHILEIEYIGP